MKQHLLGASLVAMLTGPASAGEYIVKYKDSDFLMTTKSMVGVQMVDAHEPGRLVKIRVNDAKATGILSKLMNRPDVEYVVPNFELRRFEAPVDVDALKDQWAIKKVNAERAWQLAGNRGSRRVLVAVIDTGVDYRHESLKDNSVPGYDFKDNDSDPMDVTGARNPGHGTHCAGIVGGTGLANDGIVGLSPEVSIMPIRFLGANGGGDLMAGIKSIDYAIEKGAHIISASWGATIGRAKARPLIEAVERADKAGVIFIAAAANDGRNNDSTEVYPANAGFPNTISVAASGPNDEKPSWSNFGRANVHLASPGLNILSTLPSNKYGNLSGTSMATPLVSGLVALLKAQDESLTGAEARALLQTTGAKVAIETACDCRVDAGAAMEALLEKRMLVAPAAGTLKVNETLQLAVKNGVSPFTYESSNPAAATVSASGLVTAVGEGRTTIVVTDSTGTRAETLGFHVKKSGSGGGRPGNPPENPPGNKECPYRGTPQEPLCDILCKINPSLPYCKK